jgi:hypothetical protein
MVVNGLWLADVEARGYSGNVVLRTVLISLALLGLITACGGPPLPSKGVSTSQALIGTAEWLEFEPTAVRQELFRDVARQSQAQAGAHGAVLFPMLVNGEFVGARAIEPRMDLLLAPDAGAPLILTFEGRGERFSEDRRDAFQGLSEREAAELIARTLLSHWNVSVTGPVAVVRASGAPYAAAWIDGELRLNPAFVYMAAAPLTP